MLARILWIVGSLLLSLPSGLRAQGVSTIEYQDVQFVYVPTKIADWSLHDDPHLMLTFSLASHGQRLYAAWEDDRSGRIEVIFSSSGDGGVMWSSLRFPVLKSTCSGRRSLLAKSRQFPESPQTVEMDEGSPVLKLQFGDQLQEPKKCRVFIRS